jgi:hypothetical protein
MAAAVGGERGRLALGEEVEYGLGLHSLAATLRQAGDHAFPPIR